MAERSPLKRSFSEIQFPFFKRFVRAVDGLSPSRSQIKQREQLQMWRKIRLAFPPHCFCPSVCRGQDLSAALAIRVLPCSENTFIIFSLYRHDRKDPRTGSAYKYAGRKKRRFFRVPDQTNAPAQQGRHRHKKQGFSKGFAICGSVFNFCLMIRMDHTCFTSINDNADCRQKRRQKKHDNRIQDHKTSPFPSCCGERKKGSLPEALSTRFS